MLWMLALLSATAADDPAPAPLPDVKTLLHALNENLNFTSRTSTMTMTVANSRRTRTYSLRAYGRGLDEAAIEYLSPARDKGTKMLRRGNELWLYLPSVERTQKISGHMLRQGMMGSDMSYEDMTSSTEWDVAYDGVVAGIEKVGERDHYRVELTARNDTVTYARRVTWIDTETLIPSRQELYAVSGMLVKTWEMSEVKTFGDGRRFPMKMRIEDELKEGSYTEILTTELDFEVPIEDETFSLRWLERK